MSLKSKFFIHVVIDFAAERAYKKRERKIETKVIVDTFLNLLSQHFSGPFSVKKYFKKFHFGSYITYTTSPI